MSQELDDLLGGEPTVAPKPVPRKTTITRRKPVDASAPTVAIEDEVVLPHPSQFRRPVGVTFLADILGKAPKQLYSRLARCPVKEYHIKGSTQYPLYDFLDAMAYLVTPRGNIEEWFSSKNAATLPPYVNKMWWDSAHQRNRVMKSSGDLWHTEDAIAILGRIAMTIKEETKMWIEDLPEKELLTNEQYNALVDSTNRLNDSIRLAMLDMPKRSATEASMAKTIEDELAVTDMITERDDAGDEE